MLGFQLSLLEKSLPEVHYCKKLFLISVLTLFSASAQAEKTPYLECGIEKSTYMTHDDKVIEVPPLVFRVKHGNDEPTVMLQT